MQGASSASTNRMIIEFLIKLAKVDVWKTVLCEMGLLDQLSGFIVKDFNYFPDVYDSFEPGANLVADTLIENFLLLSDLYCEILTTPSNAIKFRAQIGDKLYPMLANPDLVRGVCRIFKFLLVYGNNGEDQSDLSQLMEIAASLQHEPHLRARLMDAVQNALAFDDKLRNSFREDNGIDLLNKALLISGDSTLVFSHLEKWTRLAVTVITRNNENSLEFWRKFSMPNLSVFLDPYLESEDGRDVLCKILLTFSIEDPIFMQDLQCFENATNDQFFSSEFCVIRNIPPLLFLFGFLKEHGFQRQTRLVFGAVLKMMEKKSNRIALSSGGFFLKLLEWSETFKWISFHPSNIKDRGEKDYEIVGFFVKILRGLIEIGIARSELRMVLSKIKKAESENEMLTTFFL